MEYFKNRKLNFYKNIILKNVNVINLKKTKKLMEKLLIVQNETLLKYLNESNNLVDFWQQAYKNKLKEFYFYRSCLICILICISIPSILILTS